jgi:iron(III) transport system ATP-binding protein/putative spermidine/putrescine transport system ATP-binding protein
VQYVVRVEAGIELVAEAASSGPDAALEIGTKVWLAIAPTSVFATVTERALA